MPVAIALWQTRAQLSIWFVITQRMNLPKIIFLFVPLLDEMEREHPVRRVPMRRELLRDSIHCRFPEISSSVAARAAGLSADRANNYRSAELLVQVALI
jgi:hypothetical protein